MSSSRVLEVEHLTFRYRRSQEPALRDVSLSVGTGEVLLVAGPSGCGKSTLIRAINGLIPHSYSGEISGRVVVCGMSTADARLRDLAPLVGTVLQDPAKQLVASTVAGELAFGPENLGLARDEIHERLIEVGQATGVTALLGRTTDQLSGGESQQVAIAGALMLRPRLLVLDEPLANLDPASAHRLLALTRAFADGGTAVVIVEHRVEDVLDLRPDRVLYLDEGRTQFLGSVGDFLEVADPRLVKLPFSAWLRRATRVAGSSASPARPAERAARSPAGIPRIEWRAAHAGYDGRAVLHDVHLRLGGGERIAVLGPNGSGKTTLFKTAIGLVPLTAGQVMVDGASIADRSVADLARVFGYVFQNPSQMLFARSVREELLFGPANLGRDPARFSGLVSQSLGKVGLGDEEDIEMRPPLTLSFGQQKRLAIAVALALEPRTLVLDEPSAGQDHRSATAFMQEVERIGGLESVYFVTHDADLALSHADRILLLRDGRIVADGTPQQVIQDRELWAACNLRFSSLMEANAQWGAQTGRFLAAKELASWIAGASSGGSGGPGPAT